jgi:alpha-tubulin suppressor-like RCC1 family protein
LALVLAAPSLAAGTQANALAAGGRHSCVIVSGGGVDCWGVNPSGELGDGTTTDTSSPVEVKDVGGVGTLSKATAIAAGSDQTCAIVSGGGVDCWGVNGAGELGNGTQTSGSDVPVQVKGLGGMGTLSGAIAIAAGDVWTCAIVSGGGVDCWGDNSFGELGNGGTTGNSSVPVQVMDGGLPQRPLSGAVAIAAGSDQTCVIVSGGGVDCWGANAFGELGYGSTNPASEPVPVGGVGGSGVLSGAVAIAAGDGQTCAVVSGGGVDCWGRNGFGELGNGTTTNSDVPVQVVGVAGSGMLSGGVAVTAGSFHTCAVVSGGGVDCWGVNPQGELGNGTTTNSDVPVQVVGVAGSGTLSGAVAIAAGSFHTCVIVSGGGVDCWGLNGSGQLGNGTTNDSFVPVPVPEFFPVPSIQVLRQPVSVTVGTSVAARATVSGGDSPTGKVTFALYGNPNGTGPALFTDTESLSGGSATSASYTTTATGTDYWVATYNGDSNNSSVSSSNAGGPVTVSVASPSISTSQQPTSARVGSSIADQATVSGGESPTGTVTFKVFGPQPTAPTSCASGGTTVGTATVSGNGTFHPSARFTPSSAGDYWWYVSYGGDSNNNPAGSACGASMTKTVVASAAVGVPRLSALGVSPHRLSLAGRNLGGRCVTPTGKNNGHKRCRRAIKLKVSYTLSTAASVAFTLTHATPGRNVAGRCVKQTGENKRHARCTRATSVHGSITLEGKAGANHFTFTGTIDAHKLNPGSYQLTATPSAGGHTGTPETVKFTLVG